MIDSQVPPHHLTHVRRTQKAGGLAHVCNAGSQVDGSGDVRAGAVLDAGANRSVITLKWVTDDQGRSKWLTGRWIYPSIDWRPQRWLSERWQEKRGRAGRRKIEACFSSCDWFWCDGEPK